MTVRRISFKNSLFRAVFLLLTLLMLGCATARADALRAVRERGVLRVDPKAFDCDAYRFHSGDIAAINAYRGEYMSAYSWASMTEGILFWAAKNKA